MYEPIYQRSIRLVQHEATAARRLGLGESYNPYPVGHEMRGYWFTAHALENSRIRNQLGGLQPQLKERERVH